LAGEILRGREFTCIALRWKGAWLKEM
jgi:hypothetical protein